MTSELLQILVVFIVVPAQVSRGSFVTLISLLFGLLFSLCSLPWQTQTSSQTATNIPIDIHLINTSNSSIEILITTNLQAHWQKSCLNSHQTTKLFIKIKEDGLIEDDLILRLGKPIILWLCLGCFILCNTKSTNHFSFFRQLEV